MLRKLRDSGQASKMRTALSIPAVLNRRSNDRADDRTRNPTPTLKGYVMHKQIFINLAVKDLDKSKAFFGALGFGFNPQYTNEKAACMVINEGSIYAMLLVEDFFRTFTDKAIAAAHETTEVLTCLSCETREEVDQLVAKALAAGGKTPRPVQDYGFMYSHAFEDLDGHTWELAYMSGEPPQQ
jgi:predicted lactoylglutathione lyase